MLNQSKIESQLSKLQLHVKALLRSPAPFSLVDCHWQIWHSAATEVILLAWFHSLLGAFLGRYLMTLVSLTSWGLQVSFSITASCFFSGTDFISLWSPIPNSKKLNIPAQDFPKVQYYLCYPFLLGTQLTTIVCLLPKDLLPFSSSSLCLSASRGRRCSTAQHSLPS